MVDFQEEFITASQNDERLHTFVVHVPTLGAKEEDVPAAMALLDGPRVTHYWNESGDLGTQFSEVLDIAPTYAWDVWMIYPTDAMWTDTLAPEPHYWQHKLGVDKGVRFDATAFATQTRELLEQIGG